MHFTYLSESCIQKQSIQTSSNLYPSKKQLTIQSTFPMKLLAVSLIMLTYVSSAFSQSLKIAPVLGPSVTIPMLSKELKELFSGGTTGGQDNYLKVKFPPVVGLQVGALVDYEFDERVSLQSGLIFNFRGFTAKLKGTLEDDYGYAQKYKTKAKQSFTYLEVPVWLSYRLGDSGFKIIGGPGFSFVLSGKAKVSVKHGDVSDYESGKLNIGTDPDTDNIMPFDLNVNIGLAKEITLGDNPLEISLFAQPSLTKWTPISKEDSEYFVRHLGAGIRIAYFFSIK
jgi:hypothetical protein